MVAMRELHGLPLEVVSHAIMGLLRHWMGPNPQDIRSVSMVVFLEVSERPHRKPMNELALLSLCRPDLQ